MLARQAAALSAWYGSRPEVRRLLAIRDAKGLHVLVQLEPAQDSNEVHPAWMANRNTWIAELQSHTGDVVRLEHSDEILEERAETDGTRGVIVAALSWRDPTWV